MRTIATSGALIWDDVFIGPVEDERYVPGSGCSLIEAVGLAAVPMVEPVAGFSSVSMRGVPGRLRNPRIS